MVSIHKLFNLHNNNKNNKWQSYFVVVLLIMLQQNENESDAKFILDTLRKWCFTNKQENASIFLFANGSRFATSVFMFVSITFMTFATINAVLKFHRLVQM